MTVFINIRSFRNDLVTLANRLCAINNAPHAYLIADEMMGAIVVGYNAQDALDTLVNENGFDRNLMAEEDYSEYKANGWDDSFIYAGNTSEPFWAEHLHIEQIV